MDTINNLKVVSELIEEYVQDITCIDQKDYLKDALTSNIARSSGLPPLYVKSVVQNYFDGFSC
jgi:hypothetical protein